MIPRQIGSMTRAPEEQGGNFDIQRFSLHDMVPTKLSTILNQIRLEIQTLTKRHRFEVEMTPNQPMFRCDETHIGQVGVYSWSNSYPLGA